MTHVSSPHVACHPGQTVTLDVPGFFLKQYPVTATRQMESKGSGWVDVLFRVPLAKPSVRETTRLYRLRYTPILTACGDPPGEGARAFRVVLFYLYATADWTKDFGDLMKREQLKIYAERIPWIFVRPPSEVGLKTDAFGHKATATQRSAEALSLWEFRRPLPESGATQYCLLERDRYSDQISIWIGSEIASHAVGGVQPTDLTIRRQTDVA